MNIQAGSERRNDSAEMLKTSVEILGDGYQGMVSDPRSGAP